jgi:crotonobetaine/carnitine-CoA ligase
VIGRRIDLGSLLEERAAELGDRPFLIMADGVLLTFSEFNERVNAVAHGLAEEGVRRDTRVIIMLPNSLEFLLASYALKKLGAVEVAVNTAFRGTGLAHTLNLTEAELLILDEELVEAVAAVRDRLTSIGRVAVLGSTAAAREQLGGMDVDGFEKLVSDRGDNPGHEVADTDLAAILFTSGTTGPSKGCMLSHRYAVRQGEILSERLGLDASDCLYCPFPLYHVDAAYLTISPALVLGARAAIGRRFSASGFWDEVREFDATVFDFMGATLSILWKQEPLDNDAENPVRLAWGVPMPSWRGEFERRFGLRLAHGYGLTDGGMPTWEDVDAGEPEGSCGKAAFPYEVEIHDEADDLVAPGDIGEIVIRPMEPDVIMKGYWGMPEETTAAFRNLWLHTGDLGRMDEEGHLFFEGRKKDAIRRRGENISAFEIEQVLHEHDAVQEAVAVGVPSELSEEDVKAFVVRKPGASLDAEGMREFCRGRMARFMIPDQVEFVDEIPKTATGKPAKYKLLEREQAATEDGA